MNRIRTVALAMTVALLAAACSAHHTPTHPSMSWPPCRVTRGVSPCSGAKTTTPARAPDPGTQTRTPVPVTTGTVLTRVIPGAGSGFTARPAVIYLPPVLRQHPNTPLPTLELLHGLPGSPADWVNHGRLLETLNAFAAAHNGQAPIVVQPDINGARRADTECVSTTTGNVEGYLTTDVESYVRAHFPASDRSRRWTIAGLSEGGTCAIMLALRHSQDYGRFGEFSGLARPTVGDSDDRARTIRELFGGSVREYDRHDPTWLLRHHRYPTLTGDFACGTADPAGLAAQATLARLARAAGITSSTTTFPGGHEWRVWTKALQQLLQAMWTTH